MKSQIFDEYEPFRLLRGQARSSNLRLHYSALLGYLGNTLDFSLCEIQSLCLYQSLRDICSAATRLGIVTTFEAHRLQQVYVRKFDEIIDTCGSLTFEDATAVAPLLDLIQAGHDRLYSRLFQS